jgi:anhydro-N-acetylmuramic acid kinase
MKQEQLYIGLMSGTSVDSIDAVALRFDNDGVHIRGTYSLPIPKVIRANVFSLSEKNEVPVEFLCETDILLGELFSDAAIELMSSCSIKPKQITAIGSHGQTIRHAPPGAHQIPYSKQIGDPNIIATRTGCIVVADFRRADIASGGQGAPLVPAFHEEIFRHPRRHRAIVNIGGIANITSLPKDQDCIGFDTGPGNTLIDGWCKKHIGSDFDNNGDWGASGVVNKPLLKKLKSHPFFALPTPKSTGRETFNLAWLDTQLNQCCVESKPVSPEDVQASLCALTSQTIADSIHDLDTKVDEVFVCGGGVKNSLIMSNLEEQLNDVAIATTDNLGINPQWVEAAAFGWLAMRRIKNLPGNVPAVTGAKRRVLLGGIYGA